MPLNQETRDASSATCCSSGSLILLLFLVMRCRWRHEDQRQHASCLPGRELGRLQPEIVLEHPPEWSDTVVPYTYVLYRYHASGWHLEIGP